MSSDELIPFSASLYSQVYSNALQANNGTIITSFWQQPYSYIYQANACIENLEKVNLPSSVKNQFLGEAKFFRALFYFYLVNLFKNVPYVTSTDWTVTNTIGQTEYLNTYQKIKAELQEAKDLLGDDYSFSFGFRTRINERAATALLARVLLYMDDWNSAESESTSLISDGQFSLEPDVNNVFLSGSKESILQWELNTSRPEFNATSLGLGILPWFPGFPPGFFVSPDLLSAFEIDDQRKANWLSFSEYDASVYFYPNKYKVGLAEQVANANATEFYTVLRIAEQYLIRSEARAHQGNLIGAIEDLNMIRNRAGLPNTTASSQDEILDAIIHERRIEFFAEWGHRWLDLKRTGKIDEVMSVATPLKNTGTTWQSYQQWYPIPQSQLEVNPFLTQNPGY